jgi:streptomycin 6-kinase
VAEVVIPRNLAATVVAWELDGGRAWLARLPALVAGAAAEWDLDLGAPFEPGGNISWVAPARRADGSTCVLKVQHPHPESAPEALALETWDGAGAVRLLAHDPDRCALLLERCVPGRSVAEEPDRDAAARVGAAVAARLHAVVPPPGLPTLSAVQAAWADELEARLDRLTVADPGLGRKAVSVMRHAPDAAARAVLLHGDLNPTNLLAAAREPWLAIDPKPMVGDPAYDGPRVITQPDPLRTDDPAATVASRLAVVADGTGCDRGALAAWCLAGAVEMAMSSTAHGDPAAAGRCWEHARLVARHVP